MIQSIISNPVVAVIFVLAILIFIHELGHFAVAKYGGVGVEVFSLGFGPRIIGYKYGETDYRLSLIPFGGYVKMVGEAPDAEITEEQREKSFTFKKLPIRAAIVFAGPVMNLAFAAILMPLIFIVGIQTPAFLDKPAQIAYMEAGQVADKAGIKVGDVITGFDGKKVEKWEDLYKLPKLNTGQTYEIEIERAKARHKIKITPDKSTDSSISFAGVQPEIKPVIGEVSEGSPAKEAGLKANDEIISISGAKLTHFAQIEGLLNKTKENESVAFVVLRGKSELTLNVTPKFNTDLNKKIVGIGPKEESVTKSYGLIDSIGMGAVFAYKMTAKLFVVIKGLIVGKYSLKTLGGPIQIAQEAGKAVKAGPTSFIMLLAFISLQLGIINLFPIPVLDGGLLFFFGIEAIKGSPLSEKFMTIAQQVGMALLLLLMVLVTYNDILRLIRG